MTFADYCERFGGRILPPWQKEYLNEVYTAYREGRAEMRPMRGDGKSIKNTFIILAMAYYSMQEE